ncbi:DeoC Deoxyribose-phosphate aldolase [Fimbriimonadaceae bacterium]
MWNYSDIAKMIDHSLLNPTLTYSDLVAGCRQAVAYDVASVCIMPYAVSLCSEILQESEVKVSTTIGFPHGGHTTAAKAFEANRAIDDGAQELDMVVNVSRVKSAQWVEVQDDIRAVIEVAHGRSQKVKVIFENAYLTEDEKIRLCEICGELKADWVKTSTGYAPTGATIEDLVLMRKHSPEHVQVKAAGGVRDLDRILEVREIGVTRVGASATAKMLDEARARLGLEPIEAKASEVAGY